MKYGTTRTAMVRYDPAEIERFKAASVVLTSGAA